MTETKESLRNLVNASGFLFQLRVEQEIKSMDFPNDWEIAAREHRWFDSQEGNEGFIDLILKQGIGRMVIECKKVTDGNWVFLVSDKSSGVDRARMRWTLRNSSDKPFAQWHDFNVGPLSPEATFCIVRGQGEKDTPMLERISSLVLRSLESLANEELDYTERSDKEPCIYFPVIVTNAALHVCRFDPAKIDISTGQVDDADFEQVSCVRFRKNFSSIVSSPKPQKDLETTNKRNERTVFVVNSEKLAEFLKEWSVPYNRQPGRQWPWEGLSC
jgi:hypothetical protein